MPQVRQFEQQVERVQAHAHGVLGGGPEMTLYTRYEHGNVPVRVRRDPSGGTVYEMEVRTDGGVRVERCGSARGLMRAIYGTDNHMPFDRYFRIGRYRRAGRASGGADILTLLSPGAVVSVDHPRTTTITFDGGAGGTAGGVPSGGKGALKGAAGTVEGVEGTPDPVLEGLVEAIEGDIPPPEALVEATPELMEEFDRALVLELDRVTGVVGIDLGARSERRDTVWRADEVRKLLWRGFAGKMLSQGYDPEDVLQEVYRGLLVRNNGRCPWDRRKSTFGHYVHMVAGCVLTNYHRKQVRRIDRDAVSTSVSRDGEEMSDVGQLGSVGIESGSDVGDRLALEGLAEWLEEEEGGPEVELGKEILPLVVAGHGRSEIVRRTGRKPSLVSRALAWLRRTTAEWAREGGHGAMVPARYA